MLRCIFRLPVVLPRELILFLKRFHQRYCYTHIRLSLKVLKRKKLRFLLLKISDGTGAISNHFPCLPTYRPIRSPTIKDLEKPFWCATAILLKVHTVPYFL